MMKKFFLVAIILAPVFYLGQQGLNSDTTQAPPPGKAPQAITDKFNNEHPGIPSTWKKDGDNYQVDFIDPNSNMGQIIVYDKNGNVLRRESELDNLAYPQSINDYYIKHYPGEKYKTWSSQDHMGVRSYYINGKTGPVKFDKEGKPVQPRKNKK